MVDDFGTITRVRVQERTGRRGAVRGRAVRRRCVSTVFFFFFATQLYHRRRGWAGNGGCGGGCYIKRWSAAGTREKLLWGKETEKKKKKTRKRRKGIEYEIFFHYHAPSDAGWYALSIRAMYAMCQDCIICIHYHDHSVRAEPTCTYVCVYFVFYRRGIIVISSEKLGTRDNLRSCRRRDPHRTLSVFIVITMYTQSVQQVMYGQVLDIKSSISPKKKVPTS